MLPRDFGLKIGHAHDDEAVTGVTVALVDDPAGATFAFLPLGPATTTRQCDAGRLDHLVGRVHAACLTGGSAFGLGASGGVMDFLAERGIGNAVRASVVPTVPTAALFDLGLGRPGAYPGPALARAACENALASDGGDFARGSVGAGRGATVGKALGPAHLMKGGVGAATVSSTDGAAAFALVALNAFGDIVDVDTGELLAGARDPDDPHRLANLPARLGVDLRAAVPSPIENTTLALVAVNARLGGPALHRVARMASAGLARAIVPAHCVFDGDVLFALATGNADANENLMGHLAATAIARACADAVLSADGLGLVPDRGTLGQTR
ncbi:MAG: P1 family peptidase [Deltaproteobacteria bacterium]|nr:P1 family peptidase [Deltaproteobacteria bacterium]